RIAATGNALRGNASQQEKPTPVRFSLVHRKLSMTTRFRRREIGMSPSITASPSVRYVMRLVIAGYNCNLNNMTKPSAFDAGVKSALGESAFTVIFI
ncbi:MAG: hypothetical protein PPHEMADE_3770, partial [uncultured Paraburkholderia sp.]